MARKLRTYVHVNGEAYGPNDDVPAEVAEQITNPDAWEGGDEQSAPAQPARRSSRKNDEG